MKPNIIDKIENELKALESQYVQKLREIKLSMKDYALQHLYQLADVLSISKSTADLAAGLFHRASFELNWRLRSVIHNGIVAVLYIACRQTGTIHTFKTFATMAGVETKVLGRAFKQISQQLQLGLQPLKIDDYVKGVCAALNVPANIQRVAIELAKNGMEKIDQLNLSNFPRAIAAGSVYIAGKLMNMEITARQILQASSLTVPVFKRVVLELKDKRKILFEGISFDTSSAD